MKYLFLFLLLTACTAPNTSAGTAATGTTAQTDLRPLPEEDYKLFINSGNPYLKEYEDFFAQQLKRYGTNTAGEPLVNFTELQAFASSNSFLGIYSFMEENSKPNITNIALAKYEAGKNLSEEELEALRKPVPDWETYKRLIKTEDAYDAYYKAYIYNNKTAPNLNWFFKIYYDAQEKGYYHGKFMPTNIPALDGLIETIKDPTKEINNRERIILVTNINPSLHIYADALNKYRLYVLELKSITDNYGISMMQTAEIIFIPIYLPYGLTKSNLTIKWKPKTNHTLFYSIDYYALTNGAPAVLPVIRPYAEGKDYMVDITNTTHQPFTNFLTGSNPMSYSEDTKYAYYGVKYNYYGDISDLTNKNPPMRTNYNIYLEEDTDRGEFFRDADTGSFLLNY